MFCRADPQTIPRRLFAGDAGSGQQLRHPKKSDASLPPADRHGFKIEGVQPAPLAVVERGGLALYRRLTLFSHSVIRGQCEAAMPPSLASQR
jgi:hypothetical protein